MNSNNITDTQSRLSNILTNISNTAIETQVPQKIDEAISKVQIKTGTIERFYPYIDKALVKLDLNNKKVLCKILHQYGGGLIDLYTPSAYDNDFDDKLHEPYIIPKAVLHVCIVNVQDADDIENIIIGYYLNEEIVGFNPAKPGNVKLTSLYEDGEEYWLKFGSEGFQYKLPSTPSMQVGSKFDEDGFKEVTYSKFDEHYTKDEIDNMLKGLEEKIPSSTNPSTPSGDGGGGGGSTVNIDLANYEVDFDFQFGLSGQDDTIRINTAIVEKLLNVKQININGD